MPEGVREQLLEMITRCFGVYLDTDEIMDDSRLIEDLGFDSLDAVEFVMEIEDEFDIDIDDNTAIEWKTFGDVVEYLEEI